MYKKRQNAWKAPCMAKRHNIKKKKKCILSVYERVRHQNAEKKQEKLPIRENRIALSKTYVLSVSEILTYQNAKMHVKHLVWKNRIATRNHVLCFFFFRACYVQKRQNSFKVPFMWKRKDITRNVHYESF